MAERRPGPNDKVPCKFGCKVNGMPFVITKKNIAKHYKSRVHAREYMPPPPPVGPRIPCDYCGKMIGKTNRTRHERSCKRIRATSVSSATLDEDGEDATTLHSELTLVERETTAVADADGAADQYDEVLSDLVRSVIRTEVARLPAEDRQKQYRTRAACRERDLANWQALQDLDQELNDQLKAQDRSVRKNCRLISDLDAHKEILEKTKRWVAVTPPLLHRLEMRIGGPRLRREHLLLVVDTYAEAADVLSRGQPALNMLVLNSRRDPNDDSRWTMAERVAMLSTKVSIDCQDPLAQGDWCRGPARKRPDEMLAGLRGDKPTRGLNFLDLAGTYRTPDMLGKNRRWELIQLISETQHAGKTKAERGSASDNKGDFTEGGAFELLAERGAITLPHRDRHGCATIVECVQGVKSWSIYADSSRSAMEEWKAGDADGAHEEIPPTSCMAIPLTADQALFQRAGTFHSVVTLQNSYMIGSMHLNPSMLRSSIDASLEELECGWLTNEEPATGYQHWLLQIVAMFERDPTARLFGGLGFTIEAHEIRPIVADVANYVDNFGRFQFNSDGFRRKPTHVVQVPATPLEEPTGGATR